MTYIKKIFFSLFLVLLSTIIVNCQTTKVYNDIDEEFKLAKEWYQKGDYSLANPIFKKYYLNQNIVSNFPQFVKTETSFYYLANALNLDDALVVDAAVKFIELSEAQVARQQMLCFVLAKYYFRQKEYYLAIEYFTKAGRENLTNQEIATLQFQKAYAYFATKQFKEAKVLFNSISQIPADANYIDANYYYGFISFFDKNYSQALKSFTIAEQDDLYKNVVPFYIAEIYYFLGDKEKALEISEKALTSNPPQIHELELKQLVGHLYFDKKEYEKALPYLETYVEKNDKVRREDLYQLSFCYYASKNWLKAISGFKQLGGKEDSLAQNSMYLLADAYLKTNQKSSARNAFLFCASNSSNAIQKEVSAFNYAKLSYELGYLDVAITEFKKFNSTYPKSSYANEALELLISALANTSNYKDALSLFENLPIKSESVKKIYPRILYSRATELINDRQIAEAEILLNKVLAAPYNQSQLTFTNFWKGELSYRNGKIDEAIGYINSYLSNPSINGEVSVTNAKYNLAYCYFKIGNYKEALSNFEFITKNIQLSSSKLEQDVFLRTADCYYMLRSYQNALKNYRRIIELNIETADYASIQTSIIAGALGNEKLKIETLENIPYQFPKSELVGEAYMELAKTFMANERFENAIVNLKEIIKIKKFQSLFPEAYLKLGISYFNLNKNQESLQYFKTLTKEYPNTAESDNSIEYIRNILVENQQTSAFINFMKENGKAISFSEEDSLSYTSAYLRFEAADSVNAITGLNAYLKSYPNGKYVLNAQFLLAEMFYNKKNFENALQAYQIIISKAPNNFAERSALQLARIYYFVKEDLANGEKYFAITKAIATQQENRLEAMRGLLRCQYKLKNWNNAVTNAQELLLEKGIATDDKMMANLIIAKQSQDNNKLDEALSAYKQVISLGKTEYSAEANYRIAEIYFAQNNFKDAEKNAFDCIKKFGSYNYWLVKSYLLLGDIYFKQNDLFNAEATFKSIAENSTIAELKAEANKKLAMVIDEKNKVNKVESN